MERDRRLARGRAELRRRYTREQFYAGLSGADQHHTQTFIGSDRRQHDQRKQPGSDPKFFYWGQENGNFFKDIPTHGAMAVSANSQNPEKALEVYDLMRNDEEDYTLLNFGIEGTDYVMTDDGKLDRPEGYDADHRRPGLELLGRPHGRVRAGPGHGRAEQGRRSTTSSVPWRRTTRTRPSW